MPGDRRLRSVVRRVRAGRLWLVIAVLAVLCGAPRAAGAEPVGHPQLLPVPFLPQTEALCGGAAAAMLFRYYGDRHADVQQFAALVDRRRGGIPADQLVGAIAARGWVTTQTRGTPHALRDQLGLARPVMLLVADRPARFHFIVAVGADATHLYVHDPTWGPGRAIRWDELERRWQAAGHWMLAIAPDESRREPAPPRSSDVGATAGPVSSSAACEEAVDTAVAAVQAHGPDDAERWLTAVRTACPQASRPVSELAGLRFAQRRFDAAIDLARVAVTLDARDSYAWDVLASSRFVRDDVPGALSAWNAIARPRLDLVRIEGLSRLRYAFVAEWLALPAGQPITPSAFALADRRLRALPGLERARLRLSPGDDGWSDVTAAVVERARWPHDVASWLGRAAHAAVGRDVTADVPGWTGHGEVWSGRWRWWDNRPSVALGLAMPTVGSMRGVWRVSAAWNAQAYTTSGGPVLERDTQRHAGISLSDWWTANLHSTVEAGLDVWNHAEPLARSRTIGGGIALDQRLAGDRLSVRLAGHTWWRLGSTQDVATGVDGRRRFDSVDVRLAGRSTPREEGFVTAFSAGVHAVSAAAPRLLWPTVGDVDTTSPRLRAHPLTTRGIVDSPAFGPRVLSASLEHRRWFDAGPLMQIGVAGFVDAARAARRAGGDGRGPAVIDVGVGLRIRVAGQDDFLRVDYGHGLRDGANVVQVGWGR